MKLKMQRFSFSWIVRNLVLSTLLLGFTGLTGTAMGAGGEVHATSYSNFGEAILIALTVALVLLGLVLRTLIFWGRKQDTLSESLNFGKRSGNH